MDSGTVVAALVLRANRRSAVSLRDLARRAGTSHATIAAYRAARVSPSVATLGRVARAAGVELEASLVRSLPDRAARAQELLDVLDLAEQFPARHARRLEYPRFGRA
ncbi:MAG: helix-turn-helix transcriptional regulator [Actinobacteria bacterium]|nr:helix-turn-helix transcriptional regulator [Actinomycetota bacterium]